MVFPILWTLDPLSLGFNFWAPGAPLSRCLLGASFSSRSVPPTSFVVDRPADVFRQDTMHATMLPVLVVGRGGDVQCDSNQQPRPCQRALRFSRVSLQLFSSTFPLPRLFFSLVPFFSLLFFLFFSFQIHEMRALRVLQ